MTLVFATICASAESVSAAERIVHRGVSFSYELPDGFEPKLLPGYLHRPTFGPVDDGFAANIVITEEANQGMLDLITEKGIAQLKEAVEKFELVENNEFQTDDGLQGRVLIMHQEVGGIMVRQHQYLFQTSERIVFLTCSFAKSKKETYDPIFTKAMKTYRFEK